MKNKILFLMLLAALGVLGLSGCKDVTTAGFTNITYYPILTVLGEPSVVVPIGSNYVDAGVHAEVNGEDVTDQVVISSDVNTAVGGVYTVNFKITNADGITLTDSRTVYVVDVTPSVISSGVHTVQPGTHRFWFSTEAVVNFSGYNILILQMEPGIFYISDFMGGYYDQRAGYGSNYAMSGYFQLNADNTITALSSYVPGWGDSMDYLNDGTVDPGTGQITYKLGYAGSMEFTIIIN